MQPLVQLSFRLYIVLLHCMSGRATRERLCEVYQCKFEGLQYSAVAMQRMVANARGAVCTRRVPKFTNQTLHDQRRSAGLTAHARADYCEPQERPWSATSRSIVALQRLRDHGSLVLVLHKPRHPTQRRLCVRPRDTRTCVSLSLESNMQ
ncbi:hypothetical protein T440DRAFT_112368 [Plenodomus tracheiphilus IPT5]|uniref:Secreted protein n=1 Tax=Plenodomus tracheiphilus IPT5 TaxID=1408161 RepID=A0A6A7AP88_9PLEO|nr:hypothetical protein T440DRAFT_112368 [Plenodomus tracheiphilus IPT5]